MNTQEIYLDISEKIDVIREWITLINLNPMIISDRNNRIILMNKAAENLWGKTEAELFGKEIKILRSDLADIAEQSKRQSEIKNRGFYSGFEIIRTAPGEEHLTKVNINKVSLGNGKFCYLNQYAVEEESRLHDYRDLVRIKNEVHRNVGQISDMKQLQEELQIHYRRILYLFKQFEGVTPKKYLNEVRIQKCIEMLRDERYNFKEIAFELGYCDVSHLCNSFKEKTHKTLNEYRKQL